MSREVNGVKVPDEAMYAFPLHARIEDGKGAVVYVTSPGMTIRDWFAGQVAAGMVANQRTAGGAGDIARTIADYSYAIADAMMRSRNG